MPTKYTAKVQIPREALAALLTEDVFRDEKNRGSITKEMAQLDGKTINLEKARSYDFYADDSGLGCGWMRAWLTDIKEVAPITLSDIRMGAIFAYECPEGTTVGVLVIVGGLWGLESTNRKGKRFNWLFNLVGRNPGATYALSSAKMVDYLNGKSGSGRWFKIKDEKEDCPF